MKIDIKEHWGRLSAAKGDISRIVLALQNEWSEQLPSSPHEFEVCENHVLDLQDMVDFLAKEFVWLRGYLHAQGPEAEDRIINRDRLLDITPGTAPCSEIADSFQISIARVVSLARRLGLEPAGHVIWELADGTVREARSYDLLQWTAMKDALVQQGTLWSRDALQATPPTRLSNKTESSS